MTVPASFRTPLPNNSARARIQEVVREARAVASAFLQRFDRASPKQRRAIAVIGSVLLHVGLLLLLLPSQTGLSVSMGSATGLGDANGAGTAVTLVDTSELVLPKASQAETPVVPSGEAPEASPTPDTSEALDDTARSTQDALDATETETKPATQAVQSRSDLPSDSTAEATAGAFGQNGQANIDLWNAIAPCWNRIADSSTLPATLKITFDPDGGLALPPEIERDADAPITDQSLKSEAQALQALAECGAYPMAQGQQDVVVQFPTPGQMPEGSAGNSGQMAAAVPRGSSDMPAMSNGGP